MSAAPKRREAALTRRVEPETDKVGCVSVHVARIDGDVVYLEVDGERYRLEEGDTLHIGVKLEVLH